ncbi:MAG TPA: hypothetical protein VFD70_27540 [Anaerolineae bacterium]|nr:hypothetical protein [Anaerolineae bacterium]
MQTSLEPTTRIEFIGEPAPFQSLATSSSRTNLYLVGGRQRAQRPLSAGNQDWEGYDQGRIVEVQPQTGMWQPRVEHTSPSGDTQADSAIILQAGHIQGDELFICSQTEVLIYHLPDFQIVARYSLPCFNDLHHARPSPDGNILVANAGLEMVLELSRDGNILREWNVLGEDPWGAFSKQIDYRYISTKPHRSHPNYVFCIDDEIWVTRFHQGDAVCLTDPRKSIAISTERIHDGVVHDGLVYFTTVNGRIVIANPRTRRVEEVIDLNSMHEPGLVLGWCRGLYLDAGMVWVGFSRIRPTKFRENVSWVMHGFKRALPSHIACYDLNQHRCVMELDIEPMGLGAIYSIFPSENSTRD